MYFRQELSLFCFFIAFSTTAQTTIENEGFQQQLEQQAEQTQQEEPDYASFTEALIYYRKHPINLNHTSKEELQDLHLLSDLQINQLLSHIERNGKLLMILELQAIEGFDLSLIQNLLPYIYVSDPLNTIVLNKNKPFSKTEQSLLFRYSQVLEKQLGFRSIDNQSVAKSPNARYVGSPQKLYTRYQVQLNSHLSAGFSAEKDAGEAFLKKNIQNAAWRAKAKNGFDFYSAHLFLQHVKCIQALVLGDYTLSFGQGLTAWNGNSFGKSSVILYAKKTAQGIRPYTSVDENKFMRGIATTLQQKKFLLTLFYSHKAIDANVTDTLENGKTGVISSLQQTGMHTTIAELTDKHSVQQTIFGGNLSYRSNRFNIGITGIQNFLSATLQPMHRADNGLNSALSKNTNLGLDYNFIIQNFNFFGETTRNINSGFAFLNGVFISLHPRITFTAVHRYYSTNYQNDLNAGFSESSSTNEKGLYMGVNIQLLQAFTWSFCYDRYEFPWLRYMVDAPSHGSDANTTLTYAPSKNLNVVFRASQRNKQQNTSNDIAMKYLIQTQHNNYRLTISYTLTSTIKLSNRLELVYYQTEQSKQKGYLLYQDVRYNKPGKPLSITLRYALFQTDGYNARIYAYEHDVSGTLAIPAYYDKGSRFYILFNYTINKHIAFSFRYSQTFYDDKDILNEGTLSEIRGNKKSEVKVQVNLTPGPFP